MLSQWGEDCCVLETTWSVSQPLLQEGPVAERWDDLGDQTRGASSRSQKGQGGKLYCTPDSEATMLDRE